MKLLGCDLVIIVLKKGMIEYIYCSQLFVTQELRFKNYIYLFNC